MLSFLIVVSASVILVVATYSIYEPLGYIVAFIMVWVIFYDLFKIRYTKKE
jgi:hypothetical protein